jgi:hypothetical protein
MAQDPHTVSDFVGCQASAVADAIDFNLMTHRSKSLCHLCISDFLASNARCVEFSDDCHL